MPLCKDIKYCANELLKSHRILCITAERSKIVDHISKYIEYMIFNMITVVCILSMSQGVDKIFEEHVQYLQHYVDKRCSTQKRQRVERRMQKRKGGAFNTASFYGVAEPQYSASHSTSDVMSANIPAGIARPALQTTAIFTGGRNNCNKLNKYILRKIKDVFKFFNISINKYIPHKFVELFNKYMDELFANIKSSVKNKQLSYAKTLAIVNRSRIMREL